MNRKNEFEFDCPAGSGQDGRKCPFLKQRTEASALRLLRIAQLLQLKQRTSLLASDCRIGNEAAAIASRYDPAT